LAAALALRCTFESGGLRLDSVRHLIGSACAASWVRPFRTIENTSIAALPESFGSLSELYSVCVRRARAAARAPVRVAAALARRRTAESAGRSRGCGAARDRMRACGRRGFGRSCRRIENTPIAALPESFGSLSNLYTLCVRRLRGARTRWCSSGEGDRLRECDVGVRSCRTIADTLIAALPESFTSLSNLESLCAAGVWLRHVRVGACWSGWDAEWHANQSDAIGAVVWLCRVIADSPIAALPNSFISLSELRYLCVRRAPARLAAALARWRSLESAGLWLNPVRHAIGCARATSRVRPCRRILDTPIAALPESFGSLSELYSLCVRRAPCVRGCGTCASVSTRAGGIWRVAGRHLIGCACAASRVRPCRYIVNSTIAALPDSFGSLSKLEELCVRRAPARVAVALARWRSFESAGLWLDVVAARDRMRACDVVGSVVQDDQEHADRRAARVARQPVQSLHTVRPPGTCARGCGNLGDAEWHGIGWARATSWVRPCREIINASIAVLPASFSSLSNLYHGCACRV
jgi:hypothetical protein